MQVIAVWILYNTCGPWALSEITSKNKKEQERCSPTPQKKKKKNSSKEKNWYFLQIIYKILDLFNNSDL